LNPWNIDGLQEITEESGYQVFNILQLRLHPAIIELKRSIEQAPTGIHSVDITYIASRGRWYYTSWKGETPKSGGIATNIGVHFFDMLAWVFGPVENSIVHLDRRDCAAGTLQLKKAAVRWFLSINAQHLPAAQQQRSQRTFRSITVDGREIEFSDGFTDLHTESYREILSGRGFGLNEARTAVEIVHKIRNSPISTLAGDYHPYCLRVNAS
jgi:UDP-N-acetyl-2-amino-2-deoxyglucuronate dehydrogenase